MFIFHSCNLSKPSYKLRSHFSASQLLRNRMTRRSVRPRKLGWDSHFPYLLVTLLLRKKTFATSVTTNTVTHVHLGTCCYYWIDWIVILAARDTKEANPPPDQRPHSFAHHVILWYSLVRGRRWGERGKETVEGKVPKKYGDIQVPKRVGMRSDAALQLWRKDVFYAK